MQDRQPSHQDLLDQNPSLLRTMDSPGKIVTLDSVIGEKKDDHASILLDKDERELVKKGDEVTKEEMWQLLENKRFEKLKSSAINL